MSIVFGISIVSSFVHFEKAYSLISLTLDRFTFSKLAQFSKAYFSIVSTAFRSIAFKALQFWNEYLPIIFILSNICIESKLVQLRMLSDLLML